MPYQDWIKESFSRHWSRIFWLLFSVLGILFIFEALSRTFLLELLMGLVIVALGISRLGEELFMRKSRRDITITSRHLEEIFQWINKSYDYMRGFKERHESRFIRMDKRRIELAKKLEDSFDSLAKKLIQLENKSRKTDKDLERIREALLLLGARIKTRPERPPEPRLTDISPRQGRALELAREIPLSNRLYRERFKTSDKTAYSELKDLVGKGLLKVTGRGRTTRYMLAF